MPLALALLDAAIVVGYGVLVVALGLWHQRRQKDADDYLLGGRRLPAWAVGVSLIATSFSSISLVGWTQKGATSGLSFLQLQLGDLLGIVVVAVWFLPFFARLRLTTAYEFLERRLGGGPARLASVLFVVMTLARSGIVLLAAATVLAPLLDLHVMACIALVGGAAILYSTAGGLGAVVWTDTLQFLLIVVGVVGCFVLVAGDLPNGMDDVRTRLAATPALDADPDPARFPTLPTAILAYGVLAIAVFGTNQQAVQRFLACRDLASARRAAGLGWALGALVTVLTLGLGAAIAAWFDWSPSEPPSANMLAAFIETRVPPGLVGLLLAAILAAAMSSMDSAIHSMATTTWVDLLGAPAREGGVQPVWPTRLLTLGFGVVALGGGLLMAARGQGIIDTLLSWMGFLVGPVLGLFLVAMLRPRTSSAAAIGGVVVGYALATAANRPILDGATPLSWLGLHGIWTAAIGTLATLVAALALAPLLRASAQRTAG